MFMKQLDALNFIEVRTKELQKQHITNYGTYLFVKRIYQTL